MSKSSLWPCVSALNPGMYHRRAVSSRDFRRHGGYGKAVGSCPKAMRHRTRDCCIVKANSEDGGREVWNAVERSSDGRRFSTQVICLAHYSFECSVKP